MTIDTDTSLAGRVEELLNVRPPLADNAYFPATADQPPPPAAVVQEATIWQLERTAALEEAVRLLAGEVDRLRELAG